jgi:MFS-type transporter involved in bile tolerance (Atg22 family)
MAARAALFHCPGSFGHAVSHASLFRFCIASLMIQVGLDRIAGLAVINFPESLQPQDFPAET